MIGADPLIHTMPDRTHGTYAETKAELEAKKHAEAAAQAALLAAQETERKKSPWPTVLILVFAAIAIVASGFAVYTYTERQKLLEEIEKTENAYNSIRTANDELQNSYNELLKSYNKLKSSKTGADDESGTADNSSNPQ